MERKDFVSGGQLDSKFAEGDIVTYSVINIPTDAILTDFLFRGTGRSMKVISSPVALSIKLHDTNKDGIPLEKNGIIRDRTGFKEFYITTTQTKAGGQISLMLSHGLEFDSYGETTLASNVIARSGVCTLADTEYSIALGNNVKQLIINNVYSDALFKVSFVSGNSANGLPIQPYDHKHYDKLDFDGHTLYIQSNTAARTLYVEELT